MEEKNIKITINVECSEKSSVKKEQILLLGEVNEKRL